MALKNCEICECFLPGKFSAIYRASFLTCTWMHQECVWLLAVVVAAGNAAVAVVQESSAGVGSLQRWRLEGVAVVAGGRSSVSVAGRQRMPTAESESRVQYIIQVCINGGI